MVRHCLSFFPSSCYMGFCTPRHTKMEIKKKVISNHQLRNGAHDSLTCMQAQYVQLPHHVQPPPSHAPLPPRHLPPSPLILSSPSTPQHSLSPCLKPHCRCLAYQPPSTACAKGLCHLSIASAMHVVEFDPSLVSS